MKIKSVYSDSFQFGCISTILHRFLFRNKISNEDNCTQEEKLSTKETKPQNPCIVARLMGLDSMPVAPSFSKSRSVNSIQSCPDFLNERNSPVKSAISFREKSAFLREENEEFLLLSFSPDESDDGFEVSLEKNKRKKQRKKRRENIVKKEKCMKFRRVKREEILEKCDENGELPLILNLEKFEFEKGKVETECLSQNSSPVSVLDPPDAHRDDKFEANSPKSGRKSTEKKLQSSRRKLSSNFEDSKCSNVDEKSNKSRKSEMRFSETHNFCGYICKIVEKDLKESIWVENGNRSSKFPEEISAEIGLEILDQILMETTFELVLM